MGSEARQSPLTSLLRQLLALGLWTSYLILPSVSLRICKMGITEALTAETIEALEQLEHIKTYKVHGAERGDHRGYRNASM